MNTYFFVLGRAFDLCKAELEALLASFEVEYLADLDHVVIVSSQSELPVLEIVGRAGGIIKAGKIVGASIEMEELRTRIGDSAAEKFKDAKFRFGLSLYGSDKKAEKIAQEMVLQLNDDFEGRGLKSSYVLPDGKEMTSVQIDKYKLLGDRGADFILISTEEKTYFGLTESVQPFESWSKVDYGRPSRDAKSGMLPPKVARMMIHIGLGYFKSARPNWNKEVMVYDPFCGSGTVLTEAMRLGCKTGGSDISQKAVDDTLANIEWMISSGLYTSIESEFDLFFGYKQVLLTKEEIPVKAVEVAHALKVVPAGPVHVIVTEPYLGPAFKEIPTPGKLERIIKGLEKMYIGGLNSMKDMLTTGGVIVFAEPAFYMQNKTYKVGIIDNPERFGYTLGSKIVEYKREKAFVGRRIGVLVKKQ